MIKLEQGVAYLGFPNNVRLVNEHVEVILATDYGPRVIRYAPVGGDNILGELPPEAGDPARSSTRWHPYGGHRLWHAPEHPIRTYWPDNDAVHVDIVGPGSVRLTQTMEPHTHLQKSIEVSLDPDTSRLTLVHRMANLGAFDVRLALWALTVMNTNGRAVFPHGPFREHPQALLPAAPLVLWPYTDMADPRWTWGQRFFQLRQDPSAPAPQKIGYLNRQGWIAYARRDVLFVKRYSCATDREYPDLGCNTETFTNDLMLELESLGPVTSIAPGTAAVHTERWSLFQHVELGTEEAAMGAALEPFVSDRGAPRGR